MNSTRRAEIGVGFARKADDYVGADGRIGQQAADQIHALGIMPGAVPAVHGAQDAVGA